MLAEQLAAVALSLSEPLAKGKRLKAMSADVRVDRAMIEVNQDN